MGCGGSKSRHAVSAAAEHEPREDKVAAGPQAMLKQATGVQPTIATASSFVDGDGSLTTVEKFALCLLVRWMTAQQVVNEADVNQSGEVELAEFQDLCLNILKLPFSEQDIKDVFCAVDAEGSGSCSADEMKAVIDTAYAGVMQKRLPSASELAAEKGHDLRRDTKVRVALRCGSRVPAASHMLVPCLSRRASGAKPRHAILTRAQLVALVAHNNMKPSMMNFVAKHRDFFKTVQITTTGSTGGALEKKLGLKIARKVASGPLGGDQEIGSMITTDDCAAAFFFIDPLSAHPHDADIRALTRICEVHNCACATNPISGDALVHAFMTSPDHKAALQKSSQRGASDVVNTYLQGQQAVITSVAGK